MCGIFGYFSPDRPNLNLEKINNLLHHRGPDDAGIYQDESVILTARRLSIIDLDGGHQPVCSEDENYWLICNGEIFNSPELRRLLESKGHVFKTNSDVETILHGYEEWDESVIERLRGMFAFAIYDRSHKRLLLACDRFGIKPICYTVFKGNFVFSSEVLPILTALPARPRQINLQALWRLFEIGFIPSPISAFQEVYRLPAGHSMIVEHGEIRINRYWKPAFPRSGAHRKISFADAKAGFIEHLEDAVKAWKLSDVPIGSLLSGGIDSSTMAAFLSKFQGEQIHTFNLGFQVRSLDETSFARETADYIHSIHHEQMFTHEYYEALPEVVKRLEAPHAMTAISLYHIFKSCHDTGFKVIMTGEGADELLGGYPWYRMDARIRPYFFLPKAVLSFIGKTPMIKTPDFRKQMIYGGSRVSQRFPLWQRGIGEPEILSLLNAPPLSSFAEVLEAQYGNDIRGLHPFDQMLFLESQTRLVDYINYELDRMSMTFSVEARPAFLDHQLWEYAAQLPPNFKLTRQQDKSLLRQGMRGRLPESTINKPKKGLTNPKISWWRQKRLPDWAEDCLSPGNINRTGYFHFDEVDRLRTAHMSGRENHSEVLSIVLTTQLWDDIFIRSTT